MTTQTPTPDQVTDRLIFRDSPDGHTDYICGWRGQWPPPERMGLARGLTTGTTAAFEDGADLTEVEAHPMIVVTRYRRHSASELPEPAPADSYFFRGALYLPE